MKNYLIFLTSILLLFTTLVLASIKPVILPGTTKLASVSSNGEGGNALSRYPSLSTDGRYIAFYSEADNLVPGDFNGYGDVFLYDRQTGVTKQVTPNGGGNPHLSGDSHYIAFVSGDSGLVPGDTNEANDIFIYDQKTTGIERLSIGSNGEEANDHSWAVVISADGRFAAFWSSASNLIPEDVNGYTDIFLRDRQTQTTELISIASDGQQGNSASSNPTMSGDGRYIAFTSWSSNLVAGDTNNDLDIFVRDRLLGITERISLSSSSDQGNDDSFLPSISTDGRYIAFFSEASNLVEGDTNNLGDVFVHDRGTGITERVTVNSNGQQSEGGGLFPAISANGRYVVFGSAAGDLVAGDTNQFADVFRHDRLTGVTELVNFTTTSELGNESSGRPAISADGQYIAFDSLADNLVPNDTNEAYDVFVRYRPPITFTINYPDGAPGSFFTLTAANFPLTDTATIRVNGVTLGTVPTDSSGNFLFLLNTAGAEPGYYQITATALPNRATTILVLDSDLDIRLQESNGPVFDLPAGIGWQRIFLPLIPK